LNVDQVPTGVDRWRGPGLLDNRTSGSRHPVRSTARAVPGLHDQPAGSRSRIDAQRNGWRPAPRPAARAGRTPVLTIQEPRGWFSFEGPGSNPGSNAVRL